jgi:hypothetical protein
VELVLSQEVHPINAALLIAAKLSMDGHGDLVVLQIGAVEELGQKDLVWWSVRWILK